MNALFWHSQLTTQALLGHSQRTTRALARTIDDFLALPGHSRQCIGDSSEHFRSAIKRGRSPLGVSQGCDEGNRQAEDGAIASLGGRKSLAHLARQPSPRGCDRYAAMGLTRFHATGSSFSESHCSISSTTTSFMLLSFKAHCALNFARSVFGI